MTATSATSAALRPEGACFLVLPAQTGASSFDVLLGVGDKTRSTVRRVRIVPAAEPANGPVFDGFALLEGGSQTLVRLFVIHPETRAVLEWQLNRRQVCPCDPAAHESNGEAP